MSCQRNSRLPSFSQAFGQRSSSMSSTFVEFDSFRTVNLVNTKVLRGHPKKNALKRHLENEPEKVVVQPTQPTAKRLKSEWDLLFYNHENQSFERDHEKIKGDICHKAVVESKDTVQAKKRQSFLVRRKEMKGFFHLLEDDHIKDFLFRDKCMRITDKYLVAMVFAYFKRAGYKIREYTRINFFVALYLANDMEEDEEELKYEIFPWALGDKWREKFPRFLLKRDKLWSQIDHRAVVSRCCCDQIMAIEPDNPLWRRVRPDHHAGALRSYMKAADDDGYPKGPNGSPRKCQDCDTDSQYDSASPLSVSWYVSSGQSSPDERVVQVLKKDQVPSTTFDMNVLKKTLTDDWPPLEE